MDIVLPQYPDKRNGYRDFPAAFVGKTPQEVLELADSFVRDNTECFRDCPYATFLVAEAMYRGYTNDTPKKVKEVYEYFKTRSKPSMEDLPYSVRYLAFHLC